MTGHVQATGSRLSAEPVRRAQSEALWKEEEREKLGRETEGGYREVKVDDKKKGGERRCRPSRDRFGRNDVDGKVAGEEGAGRERKEGRRKEGKKDKEARGEIDVEKKRSTRGRHDPRKSKSHPLVGERSVDVRNTQETQVRVKRCQSISVAHARVCNLKKNDQDRGFVTLPHDFSFFRSLMLQSLLLFFTCFFFLLCSFPNFRCLPPGGRSDTTFSLERNGFRSKTPLGLPLHLL